MHTTAEGGDSVGHCNAEKDRAGSTWAGSTQTTQSLALGCPHVSKSRSLCVLVTSELDFVVCAGHAVSAL